MLSAKTSSLHATECNEICNADSSLHGTKYEKLFVVPEVQMRKDGPKGIEYRGSEFVIQSENLIIQAFNGRHVVSKN